MKRREFINAAAAGMAASSLAACATSSSATTVQASESSNGILSDAERRRMIDLARFGRKSPVSGTRGVAVSTHPLVSRAAIDVLKDGGNAVDAIVAASVTQTVVEPHMTTLSGVWSMQYFEAETGKVSYLNCSNNAPLYLPVDAAAWNAGAGEFLGDGRGVTVPGFWAGIEEALRVYGTRPKSRLCAPAIDYARNGFEIHPFLWGEIFVSVDKLGRTAAGREIYMPNGRDLVAQGDKLYQRRAADLLERLVSEGNGYFYHGEFARKFSEVVQQANGWITPEDFAAYEPQWDEPAWTSYRDFEFAGCPWPDYGGQVLGEIFNLLDLIDVQRLGPYVESGELIWRMKQFSRKVGAENVIWHYTNSRPDIEWILSRELAEERLASLPEVGLPKLSFGEESISIPPPGSNHLTVTDAAGNVATVLHSCMSLPWSNGLFVEGINICAAAAHYGSGMPIPGERIMARIGANMFLKKGKPVLVSGSPSVSLIENIIQTSSSILDFGMSIEDAVHQPRFGGDYGVTIPDAFMLESDIPQQALKVLDAKQVPYQATNPWNWMHGSFDGIAFDEAGRAYACGDPRRTAQAFAA